MLCSLVKEAAHTTAAASRPYPWLAAASYRRVMTAYPDTPRGSYSKTLRMSAFIEESAIGLYLKLSMVEQGSELTFGSALVDASRLLLAWMYHPSVIRHLSGISD